MPQIIKGEVANTVPLIDTTDANNIYIGDAKIGSSVDDPVWQILVVHKSGNVTSFLYADGDMKYDNVWADRATKNYS